MKRLTLILPLVFPLTGISLTQQQGVMAEKKQHMQEMMQGNMMNQKR